MATTELTAEELIKLRRSKGANTQQIATPIQKTSAIAPNATSVKASEMTAQDIIDKRRRDSGNANPPPVEKGWSVTDDLSAMAGGLGELATGMIDLPALAVNTTNKLVHGDYWADEDKDGLNFERDNLIPYFGDTDVGQRVQNKHPDQKESADNASWLSRKIGTGLSWLDGKRALPPIMGAVGETVDDVLGTNYAELGMGLLGGVGANKFDNFMKSRRGVNLDADVIEYIKKHAHDYDTAIANIRDGVASGREGNLGDLSKDQGLANLTAIPPKGSKAREVLDKVELARDAQNIDAFKGASGAEDYIEPLDEVSRLTGDRVSQLKKSIAQKRATEAQADKASEVKLIEEADLAQKKSDLASEKLQGGASNKPFEESKRFHTAWDNATEAERLEVSKKWDVFTQGAPLDGGLLTSGAINRMAKELKDNPRGEKLFNAKYGEITSFIKKLREGGGSTSPAEIHGVIRDIKSQVNAENLSSGGNSQSRLLSLMGKELEDSLRAMGNAKAYDDAVKTTAKFHKTYKPNTIAPKGSKNEDAETFASKFLKQGDAGAVGADRLANIGGKSPETKEAFERYLRSVASKGVVDKDFIDNYEELFEQFPTFSADLKRTKRLQDEAQALAEKTTPSALDKTRGASAAKRSARTQKLSKTVDAKAISKFNEDPIAFIDKASSKGTELEDLAKQVKGIKGGTDSLKSAVVQRVVDGITTEVTGAKTITPQAYDKFTKQRDKLEKANLITKEEADEMSAVLKDVLVSSKLKKSALAPKTNEALGTMADVMSGVSAGMVGAIVPTKHKLMLMSSLKRYFNRVFASGKVSTREYDRINEMVANPEDFLRSIPEEALGSSEKFKKYLNRYFKSSVIGREIHENNPDTQEEQENN